MDFDPENDSIKEIFSELDMFLDKNLIDEIDISIKDDEFRCIRLKLPIKENYELEDLYNYFEEKNQDRYYIITTLVTYLETPELKKYFVPNQRLNEFLYFINDPESEEQVLSIIQAEDE